MTTRDEWAAMAEHAEMHIRLAKAVHGADCTTGYEDDAKFCRAKAEAMSETPKEEVKYEWKIPEHMNFFITQHVIGCNAMKPDTVLALIASWVKWLLKENGMIRDLAMDNCPLCARFGRACVREEEKCPLYVTQIQCRDTPWHSTAIQEPGADHNMRLFIESKIPAEFKPLLDGIQYAIENAKVEPEDVKAPKEMPASVDWFLGECESIGATQMRASRSEWMVIASFIRTLWAEKREPAKEKVTFEQALTWVETASREAGLSRR